MAKRLCLADCGQWREGGVERRHTATIEAATMAACAFTREGRPGPLRIVGPIDDPSEAHRQAPPYA